MQEMKDAKTPAAGGALDPVCGMTVDPARSAGRHEHMGTVYYFCCEGCRAKFAADPEKYLAPAATREGHGESDAPLLSIGGSSAGSSSSGSSTGGAAGGIPASGGDGGGTLLTIGSGPSRA